MDTQELILRYNQGERAFGGAGLRQADLHGASLVGVDLHEASLYRAGLSKVALDEDKCCLVVPLAYLGRDRSLSLFRAGVPLVKRDIDARHLHRTLLLKAWVDSSLFGLQILTQAAATPASAWHLASGFSQPKAGLLLSRTLAPPPGRRIHHRRISRSARVSVNPRPISVGQPNQWRMKRGTIDECLE